MQSKIKKRLYLFGNIKLLLLFLLALAIVACQQTEPQLVNPLDSYTKGYREDLAEFRKKYPQETADFKRALIQGYASLNETNRLPEDDNLYLYIAVWKQLVKDGKLNALPAEIRNHEYGAPFGVYAALWEEIAKETTTATTPENLQRRIALCNLYNYELATSNCNIPPGENYMISPFLTQAGIYKIPDPVYGKSGIDIYVRQETISAEQRALAAWYYQELISAHSLPADEYVKKAKKLPEEYFRKLKELPH